MAIAIEGQNVVETGMAKSNPQPRPSRGRGRKPAAKARRVFVLDDDRGEVEAIRGVLEGEKFLCRTFTQPRECVDNLKGLDCDVLVCDLAMPEMDGHQVLAEAKSLRPDLPVIVVTGHGNIAHAVSAMKNGAANFIEKPFDKATLVDSINSALSEVDRGWLRSPVKLSKMEKLVLKHILNGNGNRHIALKIGKSVRTVEDHRSHLMRKMKVDNVVDLVKRSIALGLADTPGPND
jgi:two-component system, LuxR family, response regulator FixJ